MTDRPGGVNAAALARLVRLVDDLEARAVGYLDLETVRAAAGAAGGALAAALADDVLLVDERLRLDPATGATAPVWLCRLNRHHPVVRSLADPPPEP